MLNHKNFLKFLWFFFFILEITFIFVHIKFNNMKTFTELYKRAIEKGLKTEAYTAYFSRLFAGEELEVKRTVLIIECEEDIKYIWTNEIYNGDIENRLVNPYDDNLFFDGRYNRRNGARQCTYKKEQKALKILGF